MWPTEQELLASLNGTSLELAPGTRFRYSNLGYDLLGLVIARAGHGALREVVKKRILDPLGMTSTGFDADAVAPGKLATPHLVDASGVAKPITPVTFHAREGSGGMRSSVRDMARFIAFQLAAYPSRNDPERGPVLRSTLREAHLNTVDANAWFPDRDVGLHFDLPAAPSKGEPTLEVMSDRYGFGWGAVQNCELDDLFWHAGAGPSGYASVVEFLRDRGVGVVVLWNMFAWGVGIPVSKIVSALARTGSSPRFRAGSGSRCAASAGRSRCTWASPSTVASPSSPGRATTSPRRCTSARSASTSSPSSANGTTPGHESTWRRRRRTTTPCTSSKTSAGLTRSAKSPR
jgi:hypothetical protein